MPKLIRLYITHVAIGFGIAAVFVGMLLWFNIANLWHLISTSDKGWLALLVLWFANGIVFAGVQFAIAVMRMKDDDDDEPRGGRRQRVMRAQPQLIPVRVEAGRDQRFVRKN
ncbi:hypothetical protein G5B38_17980 [Pseudohalocynthiibacter aestuariivivens]|uniref:2TM domain-containing protein n=1 Tax=Roseovarius pelagicus TaxID=2980108 RepID=A0ABY6DDF5_9RHOB|nr:MULTISPECIES: hypothetical protein [Rhodobacterales]QIE47262.1 hypothetical protein G5B38_17980 [Pseudohalocynthiibacter aestuariivivens]UXX84182.1 hypothetical protein N7U68_05895 [Roseovarius pelagicus]